MPKKCKLPKTMTESAATKALSENFGNNLKLFYKIYKKKFRNSTDINERRTIRKNARAFAFYNPQHFREDLTKAEYTTALRDVNKCEHKGKRATLINRLKASAVTYFKDDDVFPLPMVKHLNKNNQKVVSC